MGVYQPLRYSISSLRQLPSCRSNNSKALRIKVSDFLQNSVLSGMRISLEHDGLGTLFACVVNAGGSLVSIADGHSAPYQLSPTEILLELRKYGFLITYNPRSTLSGDQLQYLMTLKGLHFDKIRVLEVRHVTSLVTAYTRHIVVFNVSNNPNWLSNTYAASTAEFDTAIQNGSAIDITNISVTKQYDWTWLDYVANIDDILADNATIGADSL